MCNDNPVFIENQGSGELANELVIKFEKKSDYSFCVNNLTNLIPEEKGSEVKVPIPYQNFFPSVVERKILKMIVKFVNCDDGEVYDSVADMCIPCQKV